MELPSILLSASSKKNFKNTLQKIFLYFREWNFLAARLKKILIFQEMELLGSNIKKFFICSQKKTFLIFREMDIIYILGNRSPEKIPYSLGSRNFFVFWRAKTLKKISYFTK